MKLRFLAFTSLLAATFLPLAVAHAQAPVFTVVKPKSAVTFHIKASVALDGKFGQWNSTLVATSTDPSTAVLDIEVQADSVSTGSGMKDGKIKGKDFFNAKTDPVISFKSTKVVQTGAQTFDVTGNFTIRGVSKVQVLTLTTNRQASGPSEIKGTMFFDRREYGMNSGIPFMKIADRVEVNVDLFFDHTSGPRFELKKMSDAPATPAAN